MGSREDERVWQLWLRDRHRLASERDADSGGGLRGMERGERGVSHRLEWLQALADKEVFTDHLRLSVQPTLR